MAQLLIVDGSALCRELLSKVLEAEGFAVAWVASGGEALAAAVRTTPALVVVDPANCGPDGFRFLELLRRQAHWKELPVLVLTEVHDKATILRVANLGVRDYMLKRRFSLAELLTRIQKYLRPASRPIAATPAAAEPPPAAPLRAKLAPAPVSPAPPAAAPVPTPEEDRRAIRAEAAADASVQILTRQQTLERIEKCTQAKTLPGVVAEVIALTSSPRGAASDLVQVLKRDPVLAARVLQVANSAAFVSQKPRINTVDEAVRNIGTGGVRGMVVSVGVFESFSSEGPEIMRCWQHSFAVASIMDRVVPVSDAAPTGIAHLTGLCHDLGEIALRQHFPTEFAAVLDLVRRTGRPQRQVESVVFGMPYHELVTALLTKMGLPPLITVPIEEHFERGVLKQASGAGSILARVLRIANVYAHALMLAPSLDAPVTPISTAEFRATFADAAPPRFDDELLRSEVLTTVNMLAGLGSIEAAKACQPLLERTDRRIWYSRHAGYSTFDPLATLLSFVGQVEVHDRPPATAAELTGYQSVVIAAARQENPAATQQELAQLIKLMAGRPLPLLYLSGADPKALPAAPFVTALRLPISLAAMTTFAQGLQAVAA